MNLSKNVEVVGVQAPLASGGTDHASSYVDLKGFLGCQFVGYVGTAGATDTCKLQVWLSTSTSSTGHASTALSMTSTAGDDDKLIVLDVYRPKRRYVKTHLTRSAAVEYGGTVAVKYGADDAPVSSTGATLVSAPLLAQGCT
jgi:hypothetical protein